MEKRKLVFILMGLEKLNNMEKPENIVTDSELENVWGNANFGPYWNEHKRDFLNNTMLKVATQYESGSTAKYIVIKLGLVKEDWTFAQKGRDYLLAVFFKGQP